MISQDDSTLRTWLTTLTSSQQKAAIGQLIRHTETLPPPNSPAALGARVWRDRWRMSRHLHILDRALLDLAERRISRLLVMMPPRHGKSVLASQFFPAWYLGTFPDHRVILASYEAHFAAGWGRKARDILEEHGPPCFGVRVRPNSSAANRWDLAGRFGGMTTAGVGGPITGRGADLLIVDDPVKNAEQALSETYRERTWQWWTSTAYTRLEPGAVALLVQTRWHDDDLSGRILREQSDEGWKVVKLPAIADEYDALGRRPGDALWPERFPLDRLDEIRRSIPTFWWEALYQQRPSGHENLLWPAAYFDGDELWFDDWPGGIELRVLALDPSKGTGTRQSDYSAFVMLAVGADGLLWVEADMSNTRPPSQLVEDGVELVRRFRPDVFRVEGNAWQDLLSPLFGEAFKRHGIRQTEPGAIHNHIKKRLRIETLDGLLRERMLRFRRTPDTELLVRQLRDFPVAGHDDGPDALEMAVRTAQEYWQTDDRETVSRL